MKFKDIEPYIDQQLNIFEFEDQEEFEEWCQGQTIDKVLTVYLIAFKRHLDDVIKQHQRHK